jgi:hypothetical protein
MISNSSKFWVDHRSCVNDRINVGVQCPETILLITAAMYKMSKATVGDPTNEQKTPQETSLHPPDSETI